MTTKNGDLPAMPVEHMDYMRVKDKPYCNGLTKREEFAARFMAAWIIHHGASNNYGYSRQTAADDAIADADALLAALERAK